MLKQLNRTILAALFATAALAAPVSATLAKPSNPSAETTQLSIESSDAPLSSMRAEHVMLATPDYAGTLDWYQTRLGFRIMHEWTVPEFPDLQLAYLEKNGFVVEVVASPNTPPLDSTASFEQRLQQPGIRHFAFLVDDVDKAIAELKARQVKIVLPPTSFPDSGRRVAFFEDNNGNLIEFLEELPLGERKPYTGGES